jgi:hypothetical protein
MTDTPAADGIGELRQLNRWAIRIEVALIALMTSAVFVSAIFTTWNQIRLRDIAEANTKLLETANDQRDGLVELTNIIQTYNESHAKQAEASFRAGAEQRICVAKVLLILPELRTEADINACDRTIVSAPPEPPKPPTTTTTGKGHSDKTPSG